MKKSLSRGHFALSPAIAFAAAQIGCTKVDVPLWDQAGVVGLGGRRGAGAKLNGSSSVVAAQEK